MRILVTGATGLIGCHAVAALLEAGGSGKAGDVDFIRNTYSTCIFNQLIC